MRLRQVATVAADLESVADDLRAVLGLSSGYRDPGVGEFGLHNVVLAIGDTFLEVVSPLRAGTTAGRFLDRQGGDSGYMVILQTDEEMALLRARMPEIGVRIVWQSDHEDICGTHLHPRDVGGAILSVDWAEPPESWRWAGPSWQSESDGAAGEITAVDIGAHDPEGMATRWLEVLASGEKRFERDGVSVVELERGSLRFIPISSHDNEGVRAFEIAIADVSAAMAEATSRGLPCRDHSVEMCGVEFRLVAGDRSADIASD